VPAPPKSARVQQAKLGLVTWRFLGALLNPRCPNTAERMPSFQSTEVECEARGPGRTSISYCQRRCLNSRRSTADKNHVGVSTR